MTEIAQIFESALRHNRSSLLRKAAINTVMRMPASTSLGDLLASDAGEAIRSLTLDELREALAEAGLRTAKRESSSLDMTRGEVSPEDALVLRMREAMGGEALTIGQIAKRLGGDSSQVRGVLDWLKQAGRVQVTGRARATRYQIVA